LIYKGDLKKLTLKSFALMYRNIILALSKAESRGSARLYNHDRTAGAEIFRPRLNFFQPRQEGGQGVHLQIRRKGGFMDGFLFMVVFAFLLFAVVLPLAGFVIGFFCYYVLPYAFAAVVSVTLAVLAGINIIFSWWVWVLGLLWAAAVHLMRMKFRNLGEEIEHHHAAHATLLIGLPLQRRKNQLAES
jgi:hypothetical protein